MNAPGDLRASLREFALGLPEAHGEHPWGERVVKVFVFHGLDETDTLGMTVKLGLASHEHALEVPGASLARYGLGRSGWMSSPLHGEAPPPDVLRGWVEESYRLVAPKRLRTLLA